MKKDFKIFVKVYSNKIIENFLLKTFKFEYFNSYLLC